MNTHIRTGVLSVLLLFLVPTTCSWVLCLGLPALVPVGFLALANPSTALPGLSNNWVAQYVVFYLLWWAFGPFIVLGQCLIGIRKSVAAFFSAPPNGLFTLSVATPVVLTPLWWSFVWYTAFPIALGCMLVSSWFFNDPRIRSLQERICARPEYQNALVFVLRHVKQMQMATQGRSANPTTRSDVVPQPNLSSSDKDGADDDAPAAQAASHTAGPPPSQQPSMKSMVVSLLSSIPFIGWLLFLYSRITSIRSFRKSYQDWKRRYYENTHQPYRYTHESRNPHVESPTKLVPKKSRPITHMRQRKVESEGKSERNPTPRHQKPSLAIPPDTKDDVLLAVPVSGARSI